MKATVGSALSWSMLLLGLNGLTACKGEDGNSCTVAQNSDGSATISCTDGTSATVSNGMNGDNGTSCTVEDNGNGTKTISCDDGTSVTVSDGVGEDGTSCTVESNGNGTSTITCEDGTTATVADGQNGASCTVSDNGNGTKTISCDDGTSVTVTDGADGSPGAATFYLAAEVPELLVVTVTNVSLGATSAVDFTVKDGAGRGAVGVLGGSSGNVRFGIAKLVPGADGSPDAWKSYINRASSGVTQATTERTGTLVDHQDGSYTYTYAADLTQVKDPVSQESISFDTALTHRQAIQLSGSVNGVSLPYYNATYDFVPNGSAVTLTKNVSSTASCNECHGKLTAHGSRIEMNYCVVCHNTGTIDADSKDSVDMSVMVHGIHSAAMRADLEAPEYMVGDNSFAEVTYPQDLRNCRKCHDGTDSATKDGDSWKTTPNMDSCGSCHANVDFATGQGHGESNQGGVQTSNEYCAMCHTADLIEQAHLTDNATTNNPSVPTGAYNFTYEITSATVDGSYQPVVTFRILKDGSPLNFSQLPADLTGSPSFLVAYASPQDDVTAPADWNQLGKSAAQPATVSIANLINSSQGTLTGPDSSGYYVATLTTSAALFPATATMRGVGLQGYYSQTGDWDHNSSTANTSLARHTVSVMKGVTGDSARREIVDSAKCGNCHEWFEGHGGNRVYTVAMCVTCHNPNLSSSGRGSSTANVSESTAAALNDAGYDAADPLTYPEASNDFKTLIHGIHASSMRETPYEFVRNRGSSGVYYYDFSEVTFPGILNNCETCHKSGTYDTSLPSGVLLSTDQTTTGNDTSTTDVANARNTVPNGTDLVTTQITSVCVACHDSEEAKVHMLDNGGMISTPRSEVLDGYLETCNMCHGSGRTADVALVHAD